jgi:hypothetical protein
MMIRAAVLTLLLGAALGWLASEQNRTRVREAEEWFLDFLVANARDSLMSHASGKASDVVLVDVREEDRAEYSTWPPAPIDYIMILKRLAEHEPEVLAVVEPLRWEKAETEFVTQLRNSLVPFPSVILGIHLSADASKPTPEQAQFAANEMPVLPFAENKDGAIPKFTHVAKISDWSLRIASQAGFSAIDGAGAPPTGSMPFVADEGTRLVPSLAAQSVTLFRHTPYVAQRLRFGTGARLSLGETFVIPLQGDGSLVVGDSPEVPMVNALELMTPDLGDEPAKAVQATLGKGKVVVLGNGPRAMLHARAIATALSMPEIQRAPASVTWGLAGLACLFCFWQLRYGRFKAVILGLIAAIAALGANLIAFQTALKWCSPVPALVAVAAGTLFCFLWPARRRLPSAPPPPDMPEAAA